LGVRQHDRGAILEPVVQQDIGPADVSYDRHLTLYHLEKRNLIGSKVLAPFVD